MQSISSRCSSFDSHIEKKLAIKVFFKKKLHKYITVLTKYLKHLEKKDRFRDSSLEQKYYPLVTPPVQENPNPEITHNPWVELWPDN